MELVFDEGELNQVLMAHVGPGLDALGKRVAKKVEQRTGKTTRSKLTTNMRGRPVVLVTIMDPAGLPIQAKHGTLTRAVAEEGVRTRRWLE